MIAAVYACKENGCKLRGMHSVSSGAYIDQSQELKQERERAGPSL